MFEELIKKFHIKFGKLQIEGFHGLPVDPRKKRTTSPFQSRFSDGRKVQVMSNSGMGNNIEMYQTNQFGYNFDTSQQQYSEMKKISEPIAVHNEEQPVS